MMLDSSTTIDYSESLAPDTYNIEGFCRGFHARRHIDQDIAISASQVCRANFISRVGPRSKCITDIVTYENPTHGHIVTLLMPYTLPERLGLLSTLSEYFFLHDDDEDEMADSSINEELVAKQKLARKAFLGELLADMMSVNPRQAQSVIAGLASYAKTAAAESRTSRAFERMEEYIDFRYDDFAADFILASTMWGMDMDPLTESERLVMTPLIRAAFIAISLVNDYYSYDVEVTRAKDVEGLMNGVAVLQRLNKLTVEDAKDALRQLAIDSDRHFLDLWSKALGSGALTPKLQRLTTALSCQMVGKAIWSSTTPRYDATRRSRRRADSVLQEPGSDLDRPVAKLTVVVRRSGSVDSTAVVQPHVKRNRKARKTKKRNYRVRSRLSSAVSLP